MTIKFDIFYNAKDKKHINCMPSTPWGKIVHFK